MKGQKQLARAVAVVCQREFAFALILQRNGAQGWERRDRLTQWRAMLSEDMLALMDAATASGVWRPDVAAANILDRPLEPSGDDPLRAATANDAFALAVEIARGEAV